MSLPDLANTPNAAADQNDRKQQTTPVHGALLLVRLEGLHRPTPAATRTARSIIPGEHNSGVIAPEGRVDTLGIIGCQAAKRTAMKPDETQAGCETKTCLDEKPSGASRTHDALNLTRRLRVVQ